MLHSQRLFISLGVCVLMVQGAQAQVHFTNCLDGTGNIFNATVLVPREATLEINATPLAIGSEIAVYSPDAQHPHLCVGVLVWQGTHSFLIVWGNDDLTLERDGLLAGELLHYRVWDRAAGVEYGSESIEVRYTQGDGRYHTDAVMVLSTLNVLVEPNTNVPEEVQLYPNYPNPFSNATTIGFSVPRKTHVMLEVYDLLGKRVATLRSEMFAAGRHEVGWTVNDMPSGLYLCRMQADGVVLRRVFTILR